MDQENWVSITRMGSSAVALCVCVVLLRLPLRMYLPDVKHQTIQGCHCLNAWQSKQKRRTRSSIERQKQTLCWARPIHAAENNSNCRCLQRPSPTKEKLVHLQQELHCEPCPTRPPADNRPSSSSVDSKCGAISLADGHWRSSILRSSGGISL